VSEAGKTRPHPIHPVERRIAVRFDAVSFSYGPVKVLEKASFHIHEGEFVALAGPNGSGKTTILKLLLGLEQPGAGRIELFGLPLGGAGGRAVRGGAAKVPPRIGYVPQQVPGDHAFPIVVRDVVRMGRLRPGGRYTAADRAAVEHALDQAEIADLAGRYYRALSGGQRRRVLVARALASLADGGAPRPGILVLDEPTANMDAESGARLFDTLGKLKGTITILIVTHDRDFVSALTDRVLCMGDDDERPYGLVQHRTGAEGRDSGDSSPRGSSRRSSRVLHEDSIPADNCYEEEPLNGGGIL
jgi:zinc transport system ATP-binding protein